jgi:hypothetical protein
LQAYHDARRVLVDELGIDPSRGLQQLHVAILRQDAELELGTPAPTAEDRVRDVAAALPAGRLVPVLGTDVGELTAHLADRSAYPASQRAALPPVAQYVAIMKGSGPLYDELRAALFAVVWHLVAGTNAGKFCHIGPDGTGTSKGSSCLAHPTTRYRAIRRTTTEPRAPSRASVSSNARTAIRLRRTRPTATERTASCSARWTAIRSVAT